MAVTAEQPAPYAPSGVFLGLLDRNREKGLPSPVTAEVLQRLGVSDSLLPRTLQALKTLDLIGEDGKPTGVLEDLRRAPEAEYKDRMAEWLKGAYAHAIDIIDPATADEVSIRDAFRHYNPISMQPRMITLFTSLFEAAGVRAKEKPSPTPKRAASSAPRITRAISRPVFARPPAGPRPNGAAGNFGGDLPPALAGLIANLPLGGWTRPDRDRFLAAFGAVLDFTVPLIEPPLPTDPAPELEGDDAPL